MTDITNTLKIVMLHIGAWFDNLLLNKQHNITKHENNDDDYDYHSAYDYRYAGNIVTNGFTIGEQVLLTPEQYADLFPESRHEYAALFPESGQEYVLK